MNRPSASRCAVAPATFSVARSRPPSLTPPQIPSPVSPATRATSVACAAIAVASIRVRVVGVDSSTPSRPERSSDPSRDATAAPARITAAGAIKLIVSPQ